MPKNKVEYIPEIDRSYISGPLGVPIGSMQGDHTKNPMALEYKGDSFDHPGIDSFNPGGDSHDRSTGMKYLQDLGTNAVQAGMGALTGGPGALIKLPLPLRALLGVGAGTGADQLINKATGGNKPLGDSVADAGLNQILQEVVPFKMEHDIHFNPPKMGMNSSLGRFFAYINPKNMINITPKTVMNNGYPLLRNAAGQFMPPTPYSVPKQLSPIERALAGLFANEAADLTVNQPSK